jgi:hypothetical protein
MRAGKESWGDTPHHVLQTPAFVQNTPRNLTECAFCSDSAIAVGTSHCAPNTQPAVWVAFGRGKNVALLEIACLRRGNLHFGVSQQIGSVAARARPDSEELGGVTIT